jgi:hypothetical protein
VLRALVVLLLLANAAFCAWSLGWLDDVVGVRAQGDREPGRMALQVDPELIHLLAPPQAPTPPASAASAVQVSTRGDAAANACLEAGPLLPTQIGTATAALQTVLPAERWTSLRNEVPGVWIVYMGRYTERETRQKKIDELRRLNVAFEDIRGIPELSDGLSLGRFTERAAADKALADLSQRGVRTARVAQLSPATTLYTLRVDGAGGGNSLGEAAALQARLNGLQGIALMGHPFKACTAASSASG